MIVEQRLLGGALPPSQGADGSEGLRRYQISMCLSVIYLTQLGQI
jgi:hypothetical protein